MTPSQFQILNKETFGQKIQILHVYIMWKYYSFLERKHLCIVYKYNDFFSSLSMYCVLCTAIAIKVSTLCSPDRWLPV